MNDFPHLNDTAFPHMGNVNVYQYQNEFDYSRYDNVQMRITICAVPWDMGEAHIGARTISGIGNVVYFGTKEKRDAWFASLPDSECFRFESKYKDLPSDLYIDVPLPFDIAAKYNYLVCEYEMFTSSNMPVMYESSDGHRKWYWFIRQVEYIAPNTTRLHLLDDAWQTWIYDIDVSGMILERGHAPMFAVNVDTYLNNPIDNAEMLLTEDVNYGDTYIARSQSEFVFNAGDMYALIICTGHPKKYWGSKSEDDWQTPGAWAIRMQSVPSYYAFALDTANLSTFLNNVEDDYPQFVQTIKAIAFVAQDLVNVTGEPFSFGSVPCYNVTASYVENRLLKLKKSDFGYSSKYSGIAKLYTYPYSYILVTDENGVQTEIHIENTSGTLNIESNVSLVFPWLTINAHLHGIGKTAAKTITFANATNRNMPIQGNWYETLMSWNIPTFGVYQDAGTYNDFATHFDREQTAYAAQNDNTSAIASASAANSNANATANTNLANANLQMALNSANNSADNSYHLSVTEADTYLNNDQASAANAYILAGVNNEVEAKDAQAAIGAASAGVSGAAEVVTNLLSGDIAGAVGAAISGGASVASTIASNNVAVNLTTAQASLARSSNTTNAAQSNSNMNSKNTAYANMASQRTTAANDYTEATAANNAATMIANAGRTYSADVANANRALATANTSIGNQIAQAALNAPNEFGAWNYGDMSVSRPMGLFANVVTQTNAAISAAGDEMLRYGYMYGKQWAFNGNWNIGKHFTYWKLKDFWVTNLNVPDMYMDRIRFFLFGGVTVWSDPGKIGKVTVYDNI